MEYVCWKRLSTVRGNATVFGAIHCAESSWLDSGPFDDAVFYLNVLEVTGTVTLSYGTSPLKDTDSFISIVPVGIPLALGARMDVVSARVAAPPIARWLRWSLNGTGTFDATFSIDVALR